MYILPSILVKFNTVIGLNEFSFKSNLNKITNRFIKSYNL